MANNLAGLAALGALGYIIKSRQDGKNLPVEDRRQPASMPEASGPSGPSRSAIDDESQWGVQTPEQRRYAAEVNPDDESQWGTAVPGQVAYKKPARPTTSSSQGSRYPTPAQRLTTSNDPRVNPNFDPTQSAGPSSYPTQGTRPSTGNIGPTVRSLRGADAIPGQSVQAPQGGERVDNPSELRRLMEAAGPGRLAGVGNLVTELATAKRAQQAYNAAKAAERENVTNPLAWMAGPKGVLGKTAKEKKALSEADTTGGAIGYKKGGPFKAKGKSKSTKMASGGSTRSSASKRGDGIASKGRTRGKMY